MADSVDGVSAVLVRTIEPQQVSKDLTVDAARFSPIGESDSFGRVALMPMLIDQFGNTDLTTDDELAPGPHGAVGSLPDIVGAERG